MPQQGAGRPRRIYATGVGERAIPSGITTPAPGARRSRRIYVAFVGEQAIPSGIRSPAPGADCPRWLHGARGNHDISSMIPKIEKRTGVKLT
jgi:hypothetical protein